MKNIAFTLFVCLFLGQFVFSQTTFTGELNLSKKEKSFSLNSSTDSLSVSIEKKEYNFDTDFQLAKIKNKVYELVTSDDTILITEAKKQVEFSNGATFNVDKKKQRQIILTNANDEVVLDAKYDLKGSVAEFEIEILNDEFEKELLAYATKFLYQFSSTEVNQIPSYYLVFYVMYAQSL